MPSLTSQGISSMEVPQPSANRFANALEHAKRVGLLGPAEGNVRDAIIETQTVARIILDRRLPTEQ